MALLFVTSVLIGNVYESDNLLSKVYAGITLAIFVFYCIYQTIKEAKALREIHRKKRYYGYDYDPSDFCYDDNKTIYKVIFIVFFAGIMGGLVGIAGGMILAPVFLTLGMLPVVVSGTNQYLAMISTMSLTCQFLYMGILNIEYTFFISIFVFSSAFIGMT